MASGGRQPKATDFVAERREPSGYFVAERREPSGYFVAERRKPSGYFVAERREPSGISAGKPGGLRRSANKNAPNGPQVSGLLNLM